MWRWRLLFARDENGDSGVWKLGVYVVGLFILMLTIWMIWAVVTGSAGDSFASGLPPNVEPR